MTNATVSAHVVMVPWSSAWRGPTQIRADRRAVRHLDGIRFAVNGRSSGGAGHRTIGMSLSLRREVVIVEWASVRAATEGQAQLNDRWRSRGADVWTTSLIPFRSKGTWGGRTVFAPPADQTAPDGAVVAVLTYAKVRVAHMFDFYARSFPKTARDAVGAGTAMLAGIGFGEVPVRHACTLSFWPRDTAVSHFAYSRKSMHGEVSRRANDHNWLAESLFARFTVADHSGSWSGSDPLADETP